MNGPASASQIDPVRKALLVPIAPEKAFSLYTTGVASWWPLDSHSVGENRAETVILEGRAGGRFYERDKDGTAAEWGVVRVWDPPHRLVYSWHPGRPEDTGQEVELRFAADGSGTRIDLEHRGWEALGDKAEAVRANYDKGWDFVFGECFARAAGA